MNRSRLEREAGRGSRHPRTGLLVAAGLMTSLMAACGQADSGRKHAMRGSGDQPAATQLIANALQSAGASGKMLTFAGGDTLHVGGSAVDFYKARNWTPAWTDRYGLTSAGKAVLSQLSRTGDDGLSPERYKYSTIQRLAATIDAAKGDQDQASAAANLDLLVSEGIARYADDLAGGSLDPKQAGLEWHFPNERVPRAQALQALVLGKNPDSLVRELRPHAVAYGRMMRALATYRQIAARGGWPLVSGAAVEGGRSSQTHERDTAATPAPAPANAPASATATGAVQALRNRLMASEDSTEAALAGAGRAAPSAMDTKLRQAVAHFQKRHGLPATGRTDRKTLEELNTPVQDRMQTLALNMDRLRWLPRDLGSFYVMVNLPAFKVDVMEGDRAVMEQKVVVGKPGWNTPVFADRMVQLIVNPYWNVPKSIVEEELGPEIAKDPNYLAKHDFEATSDGGYRQRPGDKNSLGRLKFQLTNKDDIYLHDTPAKSAFGKNDRDLSHGCVRLQDAHAMAVLIGQREGISQETIDRLEATGQNHVLELKNPVPTYIMYFTAAVDPDGSLAFYPDVYGIDAHMAGLAPKLEGKPVDHDTLARDSAATADSVKQAKISHAGKATD